MDSSRQSSTSELLHGIVRTPNVLDVGTPLDDRLRTLCAETGALLGCHRCSILLWDGHVYQGAFTWGHSPEVAEMFHLFEVPPDKQFIKDVKANQSFLVLDNARERDDTAGLAALNGIYGAALALMSEPDGTPVGLFTAEFAEPLRTFDELQSFIVIGAAQLAQAAILADRERQRCIELSEAVLEVEDHERRRIGRDIHDDALQRSFAVSMRLETILLQLDDTVLERQLSLAIDDCRLASNVLRDLANSVHPEATQVADFNERLHGILRRSAQENNWQFIVNDTSTDEPSNGVSQALVRISDQAVHNIDMHSDATTVEASISTEGNGTRLVLRDNGQGFDTNQVKIGHLGLISMRERAEINGGTFAVTSRLADGTTIDVWLPNESTLSSGN